MGGEGIIGVVGICQGQNLRVSPGFSSQLLCGPQTTYALWVLVFSYVNYRQWNVSQRVVRKSKCISDPIFCELITCQRHQSHPSQHGWAQAYDSSPLSSAAVVIFIRSSLQVWILGPWASQVVLVVKNLPADVGDIRDTGSIPWSGRSPRRGHGNSLQYSFPENTLDRGAWRAILHRVAESLNGWNDLAGTHCIFNVLRTSVYQRSFL